MEMISKLTKDSILDEEVFDEIFSQEDEIYKARLTLTLLDRAKELGVKKKFEDLLKAYTKVQKQMIEKEKNNRAVSMLDQWTNFSDCEYDRMKCLNWVADDDGIRISNTNPGSPDIIACYHPILPIERMKNLETGEEQIKLIYKRNNKWSEVIVPKTMVASSTKIVGLSALGISVTSENAKFLVRYLSDVENANDDYINIQYSSSKIGWIRDYFLPYDKDIVFDGDMRFRQLYESISVGGSRTEWYEHVKKVRATGRIEPKIMLATSFASILIKLVGALPFFVDLWGETEGGKTVTLMLGASVWANPGESRYIGDFKTTDVALEAKSDMLNNLPLILDDTSKVSAKIRDNFEGIVYDLCSGKGKSRSNKELGVNRENRWQNCILTNGERPLAGYVSQGGAINRIIEVECSEKIFDDPQLTADTLKKNYGYAGIDFVNAIKEMSVDDIKALQKHYQGLIQDDDKMQKQSISMSIILAADKIATDQLFHDGQYIDIETAKSLLTEKEMVSENERAYWFVVDKIAMNGIKFDDNPDIKTERWGAIDNDPVGKTSTAIIYSTAFDDLCKIGRFSRKAFLSWAVKKGLVETDSRGYPTKAKKLDGIVTKCVFLKIVDEIPKGFVNFNDNFEITDDIVFD